MKKNMKKLASLLLMAMLVLGLTACGSSDKSKETCIDSASAEYTADFLITNFIGAPSEDAQYESYESMYDDYRAMFIEMDVRELQEGLDGIYQNIENYEGLKIYIPAEVLQEILISYDNDFEEYGRIVSIDEYDLKGDAEEATLNVSMTFEEHPATLSLVFNEYGEVTTASIDPVYSLGEILQKAGLNTLIGMGTVFIILIFISCIIALLPKLTGMIEAAGKKKEEPIAEPAMTPKAAPVVEEELVDDLELVAVISAAIAAYTGTSSDGFVVRSIKRSKNNKWKKA